MESREVTELLHFAVVEPVLVNHHPALLKSLIDRE